MELRGRRKQRKTGGKAGLRWKVSVSKAADAVIFVKAKLLYKMHVSPIGLIFAPSSPKRNRSNSKKH